MKALKINPMDIYHDGQFCYRLITPLKVIDVVCHKNLSRLTKLAIGNKRNGWLDLYGCWEGFSPRHEYHCKIILDVFILDSLGALL